MCKRLKSGSFELSYEEKRYQIKQDKEMKIDVNFVAGVRNPRFYVNSEKRKKNNVSS